MATDYVYRNSDDSIRIRIHKPNAKADEWDFDVFEGDDCHSYCIKGACFYFRTKREAKARAESLYGPLTSINPERVTDGW